MSTATKFATLSPFPFCPADLSGSFSDYDVVGGLTLTQVMDFYWNSEDYEFSFSGTDTKSPHTADATGTWKFNPATTGGAFTNLDSFFYNVDSLTKGGAGYVALGSLPGITQPRDRACNDFEALMALEAQQSGGSFNYLPAIFWLQFYVGLDPADHTKYAIYYNLLLRAGNFYQAAGAGISFGNPLYSGAANDINQYTSGTFTIGALTFAFNCYYNWSLTGGTIACTRRSFTY